MKKLYILLFIASLALVTSSASTKFIKHTMKPGETLFAVAKKYHSTGEEVRKFNHIKSRRVLKAGSVIKIPIRLYATTTKKVNTPKKVEKKKTKIAQKKKTIHKKIAKKTKGKNRGTYAVKRGDTLFTIARKHHMTVAELLKLNGTKYKSTLKLGQKFIVKKQHLASMKKKKHIRKLKKEAKKTRVAQLHKKDKRSNRILRTALKKHSRTLAVKRVKRDTVSMDDIFFKSSRPNIAYLNKGKQGKKATNITSLAKTKLGRRYVWGATGRKNTFDCSGLTTYVYKKNGINLPRRAIAQSRVGKRIARSQLQPGDLIFFDTSKKRKGYVNHVGIYIGNGKFIHASSAKKKVVITSLSKPFYSQRFKGGRRLASSS